MKKITLLALLFAGFIGINAQITMTMESHGLMVGDAHEFTLANPVDAGVPGENITWDFSNLVPKGSNLTSYMIDPAEIEKGDEIDNANTVLQEYSNQFFFNVTEKGIEQYGTIACNSVITYDKPFVKMQYPFTYGSSFYGSFSGAYHNQNGETPFSGIYDVESDGYGILILPDATIDNVLRVKTIRTRIHDSGESSVITYRWYAADVRYPVLVIIQQQNVNGDIRTSTVAYYKNASNLKNAPLSQSNYFTDDAAGSSVNVYPNPYKDNVNVEYNLPQDGKVTITLIDGLGRKVKTLVENESQNAGNHKINFSTKENNFNSGLYYVKIDLGEDSHIKKIVELD